MEASLTPELVLYGYQNGYFPMAESLWGKQIFWYDPDPRAILPLDSFHVPRNLSKLLRQERFEVVSDRSFNEVIRACADRRNTWISVEIIRVYTALHEAGYAHSIECLQDGKLVGGLYGVAMGGAFFGESMFHRVRDASKVALVHLVRRLRENGFVLLDTQYSTSHLETFGLIEIPRAEYKRRLNVALEVQANWNG